MRDMFDLKWITVNVIIPIIGPIVLATVFALMWSLGKTNFEPNADILLDFTPRALTYYNIALASITIAKTTKNANAGSILTICTILISTIIVVFYAFTIIWLHDPNYSPSKDIYTTTAFLTFCCIFLCYMCHRKMSKSP